MITLLRTLATVVLAAVFSSSLAAAEPRPEMNDRDFSRLGVVFLENPLADAAPRYARLLLAFAMQAKSVAVVMGDEEIKWVGIKTKDKHSLLLFAAYCAGNVQSQLNSGVKRNDRYAGLLYLFRVYRFLQEKDKDYKLDEIEDLLAFHREGNLLKYVVELEKKKPTKLSPEVEEALRKLLEKK